MSGESKLFFRGTLTISVFSTRSCVEMEWMPYSFLLREGILLMFADVRENLTTREPY